MIDLKIYNHKRVINSLQSNYSSLSKNLYLIMILTQCSHILRLLPFLRVKNPELLTEFILMLEQLRVVDFYSNREKTI